MKNLVLFTQRARIAALWFIVPMLTATDLRAGEIHTAAAADDLNKVRVLIENDPALLEEKTNDGNTPLLFACIRNRMAVATFLIDKGADVKARGKGGFMALLFANDIDLIKRLIASGADVNAATELGYTPLSRAANGGNLAVAQFLIDNGANPNASDWSGPILQQVVRGDRREMAELLIKSGANLSQRNAHGRAALHVAAIRNLPNMAQLLLGHGIEVDVVDGQGRSALYYAAKHGYRGIANALVANGADKGAIVESNFGKAPQLTGTFAEGEAYLWSLGENGYAVKSKSHLLIIDPPGGIDESAEAGLANGALNASELAGQKITVLLIEPEQEPEMRPNFRIFELAKRLPGVDVVTTFNPEAQLTAQGPVPPYRLAVPNRSLTLAGLKVHAIPATLGGVGYLIEVDGLKIFYAGYHVCNDASQTGKYRKEIDFLNPLGPIDIAILPVSGHMVKPFTYAAYLYLLDQLSPKAVYLTHARGGPEDHEDCAKVLRTRQIPVEYPETRDGRGGDRFHYFRARTSQAQFGEPAAGVTVGKPQPAHDDRDLAEGYLKLDGAALNEVTQHDAMMLNYHVPMLIDRLKQSGTAIPASVNTLLSAAQEANGRNDHYSAFRLYARAAGLARGGDCPELR